MKVEKQNPTGNASNTDGGILQRPWTSHCTNEKKRSGSVNCCFIMHEQESEFNVRNYFVVVKVL